MDVAPLLRAVVANGTKGAMLKNSIRYLVSCGLSNKTALIQAQQSSIVQGQVSELPPPQQRLSHKDNTRC